MKSSTFAALMAVVLAPAATARAADGFSAEKPYDGRAEAGRRWKEKLGITDAQALKYSAAQKSKEDALRPLRAQLRDGLQKIADQVSAKAAESDVLATLDGIARTRDAIQGVERDYDQELASFLAPSQRAKLLIGASFAGYGGTAAGDKTPVDARGASGDEGEPE